MRDLFNNSKPYCKTEIIFKKCMSLLITNEANKLYTTIMYILKDRYLNKIILLIAIFLAEI